MLAHATNNFHMLHAETTNSVYSKMPILTLVKVADFVAL